MTTLQYVSVDSRNRVESETNSEITVNLSHPIHNAKTVSCISFSTSNEIYNVMEGNNKFYIEVYSTTSISTALYDFEIPPNLYTMQLLVDACNDAITAKGTLTGITINFSLLASYKVLFTCNNTSTTQKYVSLYHVNKSSFTKSVIYRLGFSRSQCSRGLGNELQSNNGILQFFYGGDTYMFSDFKIFNILHANNNDTLQSNHICFESPCSYLQLKCDLVQDFAKTFTNSDNTICLTKNDTTLQHIQIDVNVYSYIHYNSSVTDSLKHNLSHASINHFKLTLTDDHDVPFLQNSFKDFVCTLCFEIENDVGLEELNRNVLLQNQKSQFLSRHSYK
jgi:hypothetical protein